jgi:catechol 2,3-dioxygenase-like lactoylglutathione lyase family enzyme
MIDHIDHIVLTTRDREGCVRFYTEALGMKLESFNTPGAQRWALKFGTRRSICTSGARNLRRARTSLRRARSISASSRRCRSSR